MAVVAVLMTGVGAAVSACGSDGGGGSSPEEGSYISIDLDDDVTYELFVPSGWTAEPVDSQDLYGASVRFHMFADAAPEVPVGDGIVSHEIEPAQCEIEIEAAADTPRADRIHTDDTGNDYVTLLQVDEGVTEGCITVNVRAGALTDEDRAVDGAATESQIDRALAVVADIVDRSGVR